jgi:hypothetical protein
MLRSPLKPLYYLLVVAIVGGAVWIAASGGISEKEIGSGLLALIGTFLGAFLAYRLNEHREDTKERAQRKIALNRALFVLGRQINALSYIWRTHMQQFQEPLERAFNWPSLRPPPFTDLKQQIEDLEFLLDSHAEVLMRATIEDERFHQALSAIHTRSDFHVSEIQPTLMRTGLNRRDVTGVMIRAAIGDQLYERAVNQAAIAYQLVEGSRHSLVEMQDELHRIAKSLYPADLFIRVKE